ncbi:Tetratricopeptide repeat protein (plasmid) [Wenxinia marina DSM 24838]|uniref:Tetratricopeptide repeat protein n=1 Tax=Wenxinia marina DSM 24838 TaxID=1123501 RepID=A0A0D0NTA8_9RHOB|nr:Tetratricopeptide repeat protein [Wenxinia marina DSM 24838]
MIGLPRSQPANEIRRLTSLPQAAGPGFRIRSGIKGHVGIQWFVRARRRRVQERRGPASEQISRCLPKRDVPE